MFIRYSVISIATAVVFSLPTPSSAAPVFYHWYHPYDAPMSTCSQLVEEAANNVSADSNNIKTYQSTVRLDGARGIMRCLSRGSQKSWVVILSYADDRDPAKELFDRMRFVICGDCSDFVD